MKCPKCRNKALAEIEWTEMLKLGSGILYLTEKPDGKKEVSQWSQGDSISVYYSKTSFHNMAGRNGRTDVWFILDGSVWHGVNIGDNQICRVRRTKERAR
jgi:hypothetical protein